MNTKCSNPESCEYHNNKCRVFEKTCGKKLFERWNTLIEQFEDPNISGDRRGKIMLEINFMRFYLLPMMLRKERE